MICKHCGKREGTMEFSMQPISGLDYAHGVRGEMWCRRCVLEAQIAYAKERAAAIPHLESELAKEPE